MRPDAKQPARAHHIHQQEVHAAKDVVLIVGAHILQLAEVVQRNGDFAAAGIVKLEIRGARCRYRRPASSA